MVYDIRLKIYRIRKFKLDFHIKFSFLKFKTWNTIIDGFDFKMFFRQMFNVS